MNLKSQSSIEYLLVAGFSLVVIIPLIVIFFTQSNSLNNQIIGSQVYRLSQEVGDAVDEVYFMGPPTQRVVRIYMPQHVTSVNISNHTISFTVDLNSNPYTIWRYTPANVTGEIDTFPGLHRLKITAYESNVTVEELR